MYEERNNKQAPQNIEQTIHSSHSLGLMAESTLAPIPGRQCSLITNAEVQQHVKLILQGMKSAVTILHCLDTHEVSTSSSSCKTEVR
ncbi:hypothetical protein E2C01_002731 [Portunus trituberculatus]|uniref:Uncharacterized protein n=1 Tax=Portunus trituberculatus TaxID=210409 RepID=A0A5B7CK80_PORTR|nr:hypothetical protein [Portunus trituberculatus]